MSQMSYTTNSKQQQPAASKPQTIEEDFSIKIAAFERLLADILEPLIKHQSFQSMIKDVWRSCKPQSTESIDENTAAASCELFLTKIVNHELFDKETLNALELEESLLLNSMVGTLGHVLRAFVQDPYVTPGQEICCRYKTPPGKEGRSIEYTIHSNGEIEVRYRNKIDFIDPETKSPFSITLQNSLLTSMRIQKWNSTIILEVVSETPSLKEKILSQLQQQGFTTIR